MTARYRWIGAQCDAKSRQHLYVFAFADGAVKIGRSIQPQWRAYQVARTRGSAIVQAFVAPCGDGSAVEAERRALNQYWIAAHRIRRTESFDGLQFADAVLAVKVALEPLLPPGLTIRDLYADRDAAKAQEAAT